jgi:3-oxoacyl-[acyl-carrier protein] reductase
MADTTKSLAEKIALVTGGSRGIGAAVCQRLAAAGAHITLTYVQSAAAASRVAEACRRHAVKAVAVRVDAGDVAAGQQLVHQMVADAGHIDILVHNAATLTLGDLLTVTPEMFDHYVAVHLRGVFLLTQAVVPHMPAGGRIVNIGSVFGEVAPTAGLDLYAMGKFAMAGLTRAWAHDLAPRGITVNCIQPGPVHTDMNPEDGPLSGFLTPRTAIKRYGRVEEIAEMVAYLVGPQTDNVTGAMLNNDGGLSA